MYPLKWQVGMRCQFKSKVSEKRYQGTLVRRKANGFWDIDVDVWPHRQAIHENRLGAIPVPKGETFA